MTAVTERASAMLSDHRLAELFLVHAWVFAIAGVSELRRARFRPWVPLAVGMAFLCAGFGRQSWPWTEYFLSLASQTEKGELPVIACLSAGFVQGLCGRSSLPRLRSISECASILFVALILAPLALGVPVSWALFGWHVWGRAMAELFGIGKSPLLDELFRATVGAAVVASLDLIGEAVASMPVRARSAGG